MQFSLEIPYLLVFSGICSFLILFLRVYPRLTSTLVPFHKADAPHLLGFIPLREAWRPYAIFRMAGFYLFMMPLFATSYVFFGIVLEYLFFPHLIEDSDHMQFVLTIWIFSLIGSSTKWSALLAVSVTAFGAGWLIGDRWLTSTNSIFSGGICAAVVLGLWYSWFNSDNYGYDMVEQRVKLRSMRLRAMRFKSLNIFRARVSFFWSLLTPLLMVFTLAQIAVRSSFTFESVVLRYAPSTVDNIYVTLPLLLVFLNITISAFGGVLSSLQRDLITAIGVRVRLQRERPEDFQDLGNSEQESQWSSITRYTSGLFDRTDRVCHLTRIPTRHFQFGLVFFAFDAVLTASTVLGIPLLPNLGLDEMSTISSALKIPLYFWVIMQAISVHASAAFSMSMIRDINSEVLRKQVSMKKS